MLGVLKRRLKPKRAREEKESQNGRKNAHNKAEPIVPVDVARIAPSQRQIHPLFEEKAQLLAFDDSNASSRITTTTPNSKRSPENTLPFSLPPLPKSPVEPDFTASLLNTFPTATPIPTFHPAPNICVEGGRIEFIKSPSEGSNLASLNPPRSSVDKKRKPGCLSQSTAIPETKIVVGVTRAQQTESDFLNFGTADEKCDFAKEVLEAKIKELQRLLEREQEAVQKERLVAVRLQRQLAKRDAIQRDVDRERRLRADTESRLRETVSESERYRESLAGLQREFSKMEDTVRSMLQYKTTCELLNQEKVFLSAIYESRVVQYQNTITKLEQENEILKQRLRLLENINTEEISTELLERLKSLETENANLFQDADFQRKQYERCLDDIANQVVRALLSQKGLREEIGNLQRRIKELESQNHALTNVLVNKLGKGSLFALPSTDCKTNEEKNPSGLFPGAFISDVIVPDLPTPSSSNFNCKSEERKRLQPLFLRDLGDKNILRSLRSFESLVVVPLQRPKSLSLHFRTSPMALSAFDSFTSKRCQNKKGKFNLVTPSKKPSKDEGSESPESGNKDEGYSTMSSDIQNIGETNELSKRELEDLKEASDETDITADSNGEMNSTVVVEDISDPDMFFIPLNLSLAINSRQSYPPSKNFLPFQHAMRSFSDSHLCLKLTTSAVPPSVSPSVFFLKKNKATSNIPIGEITEKDSCDSKSNTGSWCSGNWWDTDFFQHWLKLDDNRLKNQQRRDMLQLQYDKTEIEEWSMSLSCEDIAKIVERESPNFCKINETAELTSGLKQTFQILTKQKSNPEIGPNQWNNCSCLNLTVDAKTEDEGNWLYEENDSKKSTWQPMSPDGSWCSGSTPNSENCSRELNDCYFNECSKMDFKDSPAASDDAEESSAIDTDFTRDFYRLVKFESSKSLTSNSSKSNCHCDLGLLHQKQTEFAQEREMALQSVLSFIVEQQKYCHNREEEDIESQSQCTPSSEKYMNHSDEIVNKEEDYYFCTNTFTSKKTNDINASKDFLEQTGKQLTECEFDVKTNQSSESTLNDFGKKNILPNKKSSSVNTCDKKFFKEPVNRKTNESLKKPNHCSADKEIITKLPVRSSKIKNSVQGCLQINKTQTAVSISESMEPLKSNFVSDFIVQNKKEENKTVSYSRNHIRNSSQKDMSDFVSSSVVNSKTLAPQSDKIKPKISCHGLQSRVRETCIPISISKKQPDISCLKQNSENKTPRSKTDLRAKRTKIPVITNKKQESFNVKKPEQLDVDSLKSISMKEMKEDTNIPVLEGRCPKGLSRSPTKISKTLESPTSKDVVIDESSFHEKATTKDVINELNKIIRKGEEVTPNNGDENLKPLDLACCCPTGWVHVERDIDFTDPKARANLLDVMLASSGSSSNSGSSSDSGGDELVAYNHLHRLHRFRRQRKASATRKEFGILRYSLSSSRRTIVGRENFFVRFGDKEKEAMACFDFLEDISAKSVSGCSSCVSLESCRSTCRKSTVSTNDQEPPSPEIDIRTPITPTTPVTPSDDSDERTGGPVSLSDSCVESYPESVGSLEEQP